MPIDDLHLDDVPVARTHHDSVSEALQGVRGAFQRFREVLADSLPTEDQLIAEAIFECIPSIMVVGTAEDWVYVSRLFSDTLGYERQHLAETKWVDVIHPDDREEVGEMARAVSAGEVAWGNVVARYRVRGTQEYIPIHWTWGPPRKDDPYGYVVALGHVVGAPASIEDQPTPTRAHAHGQIVRSDGQR